MILNWKEDETIYESKIHLQILSIISTYAGKVLRFEFNKKRKSYLDNYGKYFY